MISAEHLRWLERELYWRDEQVGAGVQRCPRDHDNELARLEAHVRGAVAQAAA